MPSIVHPATSMISDTRTAAIGEGSFFPATMVLFRTIVVNHLSVVNSQLYHAVLNGDVQPRGSSFAEKFHEIGPKCLEMSARRTDWR